MNVKKKLTLLQLIIIASRKYYLTIIGSLILVGSWYGESVLFNDFSGTIKGLESSREDIFQCSILQKAMEVSSDISALSYRFDSTEEKMYSMASKYLTELVQIKTLKSFQERLTSNLPYASETMSLIYDTLYQVVNYYCAKKDMNSLNTLLNTTRKDIFIYSGNVQIHINKEIMEYENKISNLQFWVIWLYVLGIILITVDRAKEKVYSNEQEVENLLTQINEQNIKLLRRNNKLK